MHTRTRLVEVANLLIAGPAKFLFRGQQPCERQVSLRAAKAESTCESRHLWKVQPYKGHLPWNGRCLTDIEHAVGSVKE